MRLLRNKAGRVEAGAFLVEGPQAVREAVLSSAVVHDLFVTEQAITRFVEVVASARNAGVRTTIVTADVIEAMAQTQAPQGIVASCGLLSYSLSDTVRTGVKTIVALESAADPGNVGTIIRTADAVGADGVVLTEGSVDPLGGKVVRATAGSLFHLPVVDGVTLSSLVDHARRAGMTVVAVTGDGDHDLYDWLEVAPESICWVFGTEAHGVSEDLRAAADVQLRIPMDGRAESLNVASAVAVCLFADAARRRGRLSASPHLSSD